MFNLPMANDSRQSGVSGEGVDDLDDLRRDVLLDRLASVQPECVGDLLDYAQRVIEVTR